VNLNPLNEGLNLIVYWYWQYQ